MCVENIELLQWNYRSLSTNTEYVKQHISQNIVHIFLLQSLNIKRKKLPKILGYNYPSVIQFCNINCKISAEIYRRDDIDYILCKC